MGTWSRREFLSASLAAGAAGAVAGCASDDAADESDPAGTTTEPTDTTVARAKPATINDIDHIVILIQENRSFDHYFGTRKGVRGFDDPDVARRPDGRPIWYQDSDHHPEGFVLPYRLDTTTTSGAYGPDPGHAWVLQHAYWNGGKCDSFARLEVANMGYFTAEDIPYPHALADAFMLCDHSFCSVIGPTTPNRMYSMTGTIDPDGLGGGPVFENFEGPFRWETYPERLQRAGVSWRVYQEEDDYGDNVLEFFGTAITDDAPLLLLILAFSAIPDAVTNLAVARWRAMGNGSRSAILSVFMGGGAVVLAWYLVPALGILPTSPHGFHHVHVPLHASRRCRSRRSGGTLSSRSFRSRLGRPPICQPRRATRGDVQGNVGGYA